MNSFFWDLPGELLSKMERKEGKDTCASFCGVLLKEGSSFWIKKKKKNMLPATMNQLMLKSIKVSFIYFTPHNLRLLKPHSWECPVNLLNKMLHRNPSIILEQVRAKSKAASNYLELVNWGVFAPQRRRWSVTPSYQGPGWTSRAVLTKHITDHTECLKRM